MVKLSQFRCQVLITAGLWPEKAQAQNHNPAPGRSDPKYPCLQSLEQMLCKSTLRSKPRVQRHRVGLPGSRDTGLPETQGSQDPETQGSQGPETRGSQGPETWGSQGPETGLPRGQTHHSAHSPPQLSPCRTAQPGTCPQLKLSVLQGGTRDLGVFLDLISCSCFCLFPSS